MPKRGHYSTAFKCFKPLDISEDPVQVPTKPVSYHTVRERAGQRLDNFLLATLKRVPRSRVYAMVRKGEVRVNGGRARPDRRLAEGDVVRIPPVAVPASPARGRAAERLGPSIRAAILHEDDGLVVLDKPAGIAAHGGSGVSAGVIEALRALHPAQEFELVHRLDRDTSGCLVVAKDRRTLLELHRAFREGTVTKSYDLVVAGRWPRRLKTVRDRLRRYTLPNGERRVRVDAEGLPARTDFEVVEAAEACTWLRAFPRTGRTHQIRVHAAARGHAILGDRKYADRGGDGPAARRLMLHASAIAFPLDGRRRRFEAPPDNRFVGTWESVRS